VGEKTEIKIDVDVQEDKRASAPGANVHIIKNMSSHF